MLRLARRPRYNSAKRENAPMRDCLAKLIEGLDITANPYLRALREGTMRRAEFVETQIQFLHAVVFFPRPLMVLASRLPRPEMRLSLLHNVDDEHGHGNLSISHEQTFLKLLQQLGASPDEIERRALWPEVRAFNIALSGLCTQEDPFTALAAVGIIEDIYSRLSEELGRSISARNWLPSEQPNHYSANETQDVEHAEGLYALLEDPYLTSPRYAYQIQQGFELGAYLLLRLFTDLYRARARRWTREITGPHSLADGWFLTTPPSELED
jgi:pyrroloquinoline quinone (PQQ) biosynthesis protein C